MIVCVRTHTAARMHTTAHTHVNPSQQVSTGLSGLMSRHMWPLLQSPAELQSTTNMDLSGPTIKTHIPQGKSQLVPLLPRRHTCSHRRKRLPNHKQRRAPNRASPQCKCRWNPIHFSAGPFDSKLRHLYSLPQSFWSGETANPAPRLVAGIS
jgi:hypothetical protein